MFEFPGDGENDWIPVAEFAIAHNITSRAINNYVSQGKIKSTKIGARGNRYVHRTKAHEELKAVLPIRFGDDRMGHSEFSGGDSLEEAKAEAARLKNEILKLELESKLGKVVPRDVVESIETLYISRLKSLVLQFPGEISRKTGADEKLVAAIIEQGLGQFAVALEIKKKQWDDYYQGTLSEI